MLYIPSVRNFKGIQHEKVRRVVDPKYNTLHDDLSICYYDFWRRGRSKSWLGRFDVQATPRESKALFDRLHGLIFEYRAVAFHQENQNLPEEERIPETEYNLVTDNNQVVDKRTDKAERFIVNAKDDGIDIDADAR